MGKAIDITNIRFGRLVALERSDVDKFGHARWLCKCDCGNMKVVSADSLIRKLTTSCGCFRTETLEARKIHGKGFTTEYRSWSSMKARCYNPKNKKYPLYGARGIYVCERWLNSFENFLEDMGLKPTPEHTIDRFPNNDGIYEPTNCRWGTDAEQSRNRRTNVWFEHDGKRMVITDWAKYLGVTFSAVKYQLQIGKSFPEIFYYYKNKIT